MSHDILLLIAGASTLAALSVIFDCCGLQRSLLLVRYGKKAAASERGVHE